MRSESQRSVRGADERARRWRRILLSVGLVASAASCHTRGINSDLLLEAFNGGATDSIPDPLLSPEEIAEERVALVAKSSLIRGFSSQGVRNGPSIATWLEDRNVKALVIGHLTRRRAACPALPPPAPSASAASSAEPAPTTAPGGAPPPPQGNAPTPSVAQSDATVESDGCAASLRKGLFDYLLKNAAAGVVVPAGPVCRDREVTRTGELYGDAARLAAAIDIATIEVARMLDQERVVDGFRAAKGFEKAMDEAAMYLRDRRWQPSHRAPTFGLAIKGGASSGVYSAGVVWRVLTLLQRYREWKSAPTGGLPDAHATNGIEPPEARFAVASGTSAGAVIAAVVDIFHEESCLIDCDLDPNPAKCRLPECAAATSCSPSKEVRDAQTEPSGKMVVESARYCQEYARTLTASLFTCPSQAQLYCLDSRPVWELLGKQKGLMDFDGLRDYIAKYVTADALVDPTELVLTTVDFRWGQLYVQSDQDPSTVLSTFGLKPGEVNAEAVKQVSRNIQASFVLPFIAWPVAKLRVRGADRDGIFLDGGIQSELPINALWQRGVERAIVVGSAPPESTPIALPKNAAEIAKRYLDVSLSGVTASEWRDAIPHARYVEAFETSACRALFDAFPQIDRPGDLEAFCSGRLAEGCGGTAYAPTSKLPDPRDPRARLPETVSRIVKSHETGRKFDIVGIFRNESVAPTFGYSFDPVQMRRLFGNGVADGRSRCVELAYFLGMGDAADELDEWCNETPKFNRLLCKPAEEEQKTCAYRPEDPSRPH